MRVYVNDTSLTNFWGNFFLHFFADELNYRHFGEIEDGVDMRGEVALLSRNVKIAGSMKRGCPAENGNCDNKLWSLDTYGGHIKVNL